MRRPRKLKLKLSRRSRPKLRGSDSRLPRKLKLKLSRRSRPKPRKPRLRGVGQHPRSDGKLRF